MYSEDSFGQVEGGDTDCAFRRMHSVRLRKVMLIVFCSKWGRGNGPEKTVYEVHYVEKERVPLERVDNELR